MSRHRIASRRAGTTLALAVVLGLAVSACGDVDAGSAAEENFQTFLRNHPVAGYEAVYVGGSNDLPFAGTLAVTMAASGPDPAPADLVVAMDDVADQVCRFDPEASVAVEFGFQVGEYVVPLSCGPGPSSRAERADQAALLIDLMALPQLASAEAEVGAGRGSLTVTTTRDSDSEVSRAAVEAAVTEVVGRHVVAFGVDDAGDVSIAVSSVAAPTSTPTSSPGSTPANTPANTPSDTPTATTTG